MALKIRLRQHGRSKRPFYRVIVTDSRNPRDGRYVECVGWYNPLEAEAEKNLSLKKSSKFFSLIFILYFCGSTVDPLVDHPYCR